MVYEKIGHRKISMNKLNTDFRTKHAIIIDYDLNFSVLSSSKPKVSIYLIGVDILISEV